MGSGIIMRMLPIWYNLKMCNDLLNSQSHTQAKYQDYVYPPAFSKKI